MDDNNIEELETKKTRGRKKKLSVLEAVDNLSHLAELNEENKPASHWLNPQESQDNKEKIRETFNTINHYLQHVYQRQKTQLKDADAQQGIRAIMDLAEEANQKIKKYTGLFKGVIEAEGDIEEYHKLHKFYLSKVVAKSNGEQTASAAVEDKQEERQALKDLEVVKQDGDYELFYIYGEDGLPFFHPNLLRHIKMLGSFDESLIKQSGDDLLRELDALLDTSFQERARSILQEVRDKVSLFYKECSKFQKQECVRCLYQAIMALILAASSRPAERGARDKGACHYFSDFQRFVRQTLESTELKGATTGGQEISKEPYIRHALNLVFLFCDYIFLYSAYPVGFFNLVQLWQMQKIKEGQNYLTSLAQTDEAILGKLKELPSGPLLKAVRMFEEGRDREGFDPCLQGSCPSQLFNISTETMQVACLHLPSPTHQEYIDQVQVNAEFLGFLKRPGGHKHLLVNLQDKTSWKEFQRSSALEELSRNGHFSDNLVVVSLAMEGNFYNQIQDYANLEAWSEFSLVFLQQLREGESCGFYFPMAYLKDGKVFQSLIDFVHVAFFESKKRLDRKERLEFIEIFYLFLILYLLDKEAPTTVSLSCKDGVDKSSALTAAFFGLMQHLSHKKKFTEHELQFFIYTLFYPALLVRHRNIQSRNLYRTLSTLEKVGHAFSHQREKILKTAADLLPDLEIHKLEVFDVA